MSALAVGSRQSIWYPVADKTPLGEDYNPTTDDVRLALTDGTTPTALQWMNADWESGTINVEGTDYHLARVEVGEGTGHLYPKGFYNLWIEINSSDDPYVGKGEIVQFY